MIGEIKILSECLSMFALAAIVLPLPLLISLLPLCASGKPRSAKPGVLEKKKENEITPPKVLESSPSKPAQAVVAPKPAVQPVNESPKVPPKKPEPKKEPEVKQTAKKDATIKTSSEEMKKETVTKSSEAPGKTKEEGGGEEVMVIKPKEDVEPKTDLESHKESEDDRKEKDNEKKEKENEKEQKPGKRRGKDGKLEKSGYAFDGINKV